MKRDERILLFFATLLASSVLLYSAGCGSSREKFADDGPAPASTTDPNQAFGDGGAADVAGPPEVTRDPQTCEEAKQTRSYVGCDYWPTVTANNVWSIFDYTVVVSNTSSTAVDVTVTGPN